MPSRRNAASPRRPGPSLLPLRVDRLEEWLEAPVEARCADDRFEVRRATPADYPAIFDLVDVAFGRSRPRALGDWLYRANPSGEARCWITVERATGELVANETRLPWPFARGDEPLRGEMIADAAVTPRLQRRDVGDLRAPFRKGHPWYAETTAISWPNERSRRAAIKHGYASRLFGPLPRVELPLRAAAFLKPERWPRLVRIAEAPVVAAGDGLLAAWQRGALAGPTLATHPVQRFDASFDPVTAACMTWPGIWSPHSAEFLNWRYLDHPTHSYAAIAATRGDRPVGYAVVRIDSGEARLMELAAPDAACRRSLLTSVRALAREAGCDRIHFFSTGRWRHAGFLRRAGFVPRASQWWVQARSPGEAPISGWQLLPGDTDVL